MYTKTITQVEDYVCIKKNQIIKITYKLNKKIK